MVGSCVSFGELLQPPPTSHDLDQLHHHISLQQLGDRLQKAANAAFPNDKRMRYTSVYVLLLLWRDEDPNLPVSLEALELKDVFENVYHFTVEAWEIPSDGSHKRVNQKILDFIELGGDSKDDLKIVYYGGHGMLGSSRQSCWARYVKTLSIIISPILTVVLQPAQSRRSQFSNCEMEWDSTCARRSGVRRSPSFRLLFIGNCKCGCWQRRHRAHSCLWFQRKCKSSWDLFIYSCSNYRTSDVKYEDSFYSWGVV